MKDDTQPDAYGNTGLRKRKKKDRSLKTEKSKTKGIMQVETDTGQTVYMQVEPETGQTAYTQVEPNTGQTAYTSSSMAIQQPEEDGRTALPSLQLQLKPLDDDSARPTSGRAIDQQTTVPSVESSLSMLQLEDIVDRFLPEQQVHDFRSKPETELESSERSVPAACKQQCYREEPLATPEIEIQGEESPPSEDNLVHEDTHDDVPKRRYRKGKAETDAKAGATRHLSRYPNGIA